MNKASYRDSLCISLIKAALLVTTTLTGFTACAQSSSVTDNAVDAEIGSITAQQKAEILVKYSHVDPEHLIRTDALATALVYFDRHPEKIRNKSYLAVIDFAKNSAEKRFSIVNMNNGTVWNVHVAHGKGSDEDWDGNAESFSNQDSSYKSSLGFYLTDESYYGDHGLSLRLDGLSSTNSNARERAIVIHGASYVHEVDEIQGRSWGCPAVDMRIRDTVVNVLKDGSLIFAAR